MLERARAVAGKDEEDRGARHGREREREEDDELAYLAEGERAVDLGDARLAEPLHGVGAVGDDVAPVGD